MKRIFPFLFTFLLLCLTGCTAAAEIGYTQIDQETAKEIHIPTAAMALAGISL